MPNKVAAIYDIHGNDVALEAVLKEIKQIGAETIIIGGDLAWGPQPAEVMNRLLSLASDVRYISGNADREVASRYGVAQGLDPTTAKINQWCADQLSKTQLDFLQKMESDISLHIEGVGDVLFVHGSPRGDEEAMRIDTPEEELVPMLTSVHEEIIVCGHTHIQFDRMAHGKRIINAGSVGLQSAARGACWLLFDNGIELRETEYDYEHAAKLIRASGVPMAEDFAQHILHPPVEGP